MENPVVSPLGNLTNQYLGRDPAHSGIIVSPNEYTLELYPAGYTKVSEKDKTSRQFFLLELWKKAVVMNNETIDYPFYSIAHSIRLEYDQTNLVDPCAMRIIFVAPKHSVFYKFNDRDMGYVPMKISSLLFKNKDMISGGRILRLRANWHKKYFTAKVILGWNEVFNLGSNPDDSTRFFDIATEIK